MDLNVLSDDVLDRLSPETLKGMASGNVTSVDQFSDADLDRLPAPVLQHLASGGYSNYGPNELQGPDVQYDRGKGTNIKKEVLGNNLSASVDQFTKNELGWKDGVPPLAVLPMGTGANLLKAAAGSAMNRGAIKGLGASPGSPLLEATAKGAWDPTEARAVEQALEETAGAKTDWSSLAKTVKTGATTGGAGLVGGHYLGIDPNFGGPAGTGLAIGTGVPLAVGTALSPLGGIALDQLAINAIARRRGGGK